MNQHLTTEDDGQTIEVSIGDEVILELGENPSTGYRWQAECDSILTLVLSDWVTGASSRVGTSGIRRFQFRAVGLGSGFIKVKHWREWIGNSSVIAQHTFTILVR